MSTSSDTIKMKQYGPISVRVCRKQIPTLETGRRSKHLILVGPEAEKREKRRERNREAAKKLKEKRQIIEDDLAERIRQLENQYSNLKNRIETLNERKNNLLYELNEQLFSEIDELLSDVCESDTTKSESHSPTMDVFDDAFEEIVNHHMKDCFDTTIDS